MGLTTLERTALATVVAPASNNTRAFACEVQFSNIQGLGGAQAFKQSCLVYFFPCGNRFPQGSPRDRDTLWLCRDVPFACHFVLFLNAIVLDCMSL